MTIETVKAVVFDTFGTITDWRSSIAAEGAKIAHTKGIEDFNGDAFARAWRAGYRPGMARVTSGERGWTPVDVIHRERLEEILPQFGLDMLNDDERTHLNEAWHRINPWPDSIPGLLRIKKKYLIAPAIERVIDAFDQHGKTGRHSVGLYIFQRHAPGL